MLRPVAGVGRIPALDGLRALAILLVIPHNSNFFEVAHDWTKLAAIVAHAGWIGVQIFFVLSGFLITRGLLETAGRKDYFRAFFERRVRRIFPLYFLSLTLFLIVLPALVTLPGDVLSTYRDQGLLWVFLNNWVQAYRAPVYWFSHYWSLAVEEQFYLAWPLVVLVATERRLLAVCGAMIAIAIGCRIGTFTAGMPDGIQYLWTICRMDALAFGAAVAVMVRSDAASWLQRRGTLVVLCGVGLVLLTGAATGGFQANHPVMRLVGFSGIAAGFAAVLAALAAGGGSPVVGWLGRRLSAPLWQSVAKVSFAMYVVHLPITLLAFPRVYPLLAPLGTMAPVVFCLLIIVASYLIAWLSWHGLEKHCLKRRASDLAPR